MEIVKLGILSGILLKQTRFLAATSIHLNSLKTIHGQKAITSWKNSTSLYKINGNRKQYLHGTACHLTDKVLTEMTDKDWEKKLTPEQYYVCRERGTEPPFSGKFYNHFEKGIYSCVCCGAELFSSESKFQSGCGWPSFHTAYGAVNGDESKSNIIRRPDHTRGMRRTEVICKKCDAHLGHVFNDGPKPTGERFCINSLTLNFTPKE